MIKCPECGFSLTGDEKVCPQCGYVLKKEEVAVQPEGVNPPPPPETPESGVTPPQPEAGKKTIPFEDSSLPFFERFFKTIKLCLLSPSEFFGEYNFKTSIGLALLFAVIMGFIASFFNFVYQLIFRTSLMSMIAKFGDIPMNELHTQNAFFMAGGVMGLIFVPVAVIIGIFVMAGLYHLILMMMGGAKNGFESTFNVVAYSSAVNIFSVVPFCGGTIGGIYNIILNIIGLAKVHETSTGKSAFAVLAPIILCCLCVVVYFVFLFGVIGMAALGSR